MSQPGFWDHQETAQKIVTESAALKNVLSPVEAFHDRLEDLKAMVELAEEGDDDDAREMAADISTTAREMSAEIERLELLSFLSAPNDRNNAIISIHAGAGGTESCDWADMLLRMYTRWAERNGFKVEPEDIQPGDEAGISRAILRIVGEFAFGYAKAERGVHRLVRISPFDSNKRRHTSFCAVDVIAEVSDDVDITLPDNELRIDVYRASGAGGQHVNRTESAVRITHLPTNIVVTCQNDRSQIKNRATAMTILKSRIYEKRQDEKRAEMERYYGEKNEIGWGNQIRSYVFQPYQMVKDLRTGCETGNVQAVMDGELDRFIHDWLRAGMPRTRNKDVNLDD
jgi:peptide chain release factor 2